MWIDDTQQQGQDPWYGQQQQQGHGYANQNGGDLGWNSFDYSQPSAPEQQPSGYYQQQQSSGYGHQPQSNYYGGNMFIPNQNGGIPSAPGEEDFENEPPLLEELGINFSHIREKTVAVLNPVGHASAEVIADQDLAGPLVFCLLFGGALLLHGKLQFGYIYGIGGLGCLGMYALMNQMASTSSISFTCTASVLGYCLLPMALLSLIAAVLSFQAFLGYVISALAVFWCSLSSSKLFVIALDLQDQRLLVAYPCVLLYSVFALLAIF